MSAARSLGTIPYFVPVEHTVATRAALGPGVLIAPELAVAVDSDPGRGLAKSREYASRYLGLKNYTNNLLRHGFHARDIADGGSDRLIHEVVPHGTAEQVTDIARARKFYEGPLGLTESILRTAAWHQQFLQST